MAAAHAFTDLGWDVRVLEAEPEVRTSGAGLILWPKGSNALVQLGLGEVLDPIARVIPEMSTARADGRALTSMRLGLDHPLVSVLRADLQTALCAKFAGEIEVGTPVRADGVRLFAGDEPLVADLIIGADGIRSETRAFVAPRSAQRPAGYVAWRGIAAVAQESSSAVEYLGRGKRFGIVPLNDGLTYWFAAFGGSDEEHDLAQEFADWHEPITSTLAAPIVGQRSCLPINDLPRLSSWLRDNVVLVGDAAHAMTPNMGQGAAHGLMDIAALKQAFREHPVPAALAHYQRRRKKDAERAVARSRAFGRVLQLEGLLATRARDAAMRATPQFIVDWQIGSMVHDRSR